MILGLLITNDGPHPPEKLAGAATQRFLDDFQQNAPAAAYSDVVAARDEIDRILTAYHRDVQDGERAALAKSTSRLAEPIDHSDPVRDAVAEIMATMLARYPSATQYQTLQAYFRRPETKRYFEEVLHREFHHNAWIERSWHADANADHPAAKAFAAVRTYGHAVLSHPDPAKPAQLSALAEHGGRELVHAIVTASQPTKKMEA